MLAKEIIMRAKSIKGNSAAEISSALYDCISDGFTPTLAFVFVSVEQDIKTIMEILHKQNIEIFGATTAGEFIDGEIGEGSIVMLLLDIRRSSFKILIEPINDVEMSSFARNIAEAGIDNFSEPAYIVATAGRSVDCELLIDEIEKTVGPDLVIFGGKAGDDYKDGNTFVFNENTVTPNGVITLFIDQDRININGITGHGWKPVGTIKTVTKSEDRTIFTIDNEPALDIFMKYMGVSLGSPPQNGVVYNTDQLCPIQIIRDNGSSVMREASYVNSNDQSIVFPVPIPEGTQFRFSLPPDFDIVDVMARECEQIKIEKLPQADAVVIFSCAGRKLALGPMIGREIELVNQVWQSPMAGFFCYGEIGKSEGGKNEFHNNTCCVVALKEK